MHISLDSGRIVTLVRLQQCLTYHGVLCGLPRERLDLGHIERMRKEAAKLVVEGAIPLLLTPPKIAPLPRVTCIGVFESGELARPGSDLYSSAAVLWFQDEFAMPIAPHALLEIMTIDWEGTASDWSW